MGAKLTYLDARAHASVYTRIIFTRSRFLIAGTNKRNTTSIDFASMAKNKTTTKTAKEEKKNKKKGGGGCFGGGKKKDKENNAPATTTTTNAQQHQGRETKFSQKGNADANIKQELEGEDTESEHSADSDGLHSNGWIRYYDEATGNFYYVREDGIGEAQWNKPLEFIVPTDESERETIIREQQRQQVLEEEKKIRERKELEKKRNENEKQFKEDEKKRKKKLEQEAKQRAIDEEKMKMELLKQENSREKENARLKMEEEQALKEKMLAAKLAAKAKEQETERQRKEQEAIALK